MKTTHAVRTDSRVTPDYSVYSIPLKDASSYYFAVPEGRTVPIGAKVREVGLAKSDAQLIVKQQNRYAVGA